MYISMEFIAAGLVEMIGGLASAVVLAGLCVVGAGACLAGAWLATHWLLRESGVWRDRNTDEVRHGPAAGRVRLSPGRRSAGRQGAAALRLAGLDGRPLPIMPRSSFSTAVAGHAATRAAAGLEPASGGGRQHRGLLRRWRPRPQRAYWPWTGW